MDRDDKTGRDAALSEAGQLRHGEFDDTGAALERFFNAGRQAYEKQCEEWQRTASRFNLFKVINFRDRELLHSRLLTFLLDPQEHHDRGDRFLRSFLKAIRDHDRGQPSLRSFLEAMLHSTTPLDSVSVKKEGPVEHGRVDIVISWPGERKRIFIENKVNAREGEEQIARYQKSLRGFDGVVVFLTPDGREPKTKQADGAPVVSLSYHELARRLQEGDEKLPARLLETIRMYAEICDELAGEATVNSQQMREFLLSGSKDDLRVAFAIAEELPELKVVILKEFWERVRADIEQRLRANSRNDRWKVLLSPEIDRGDKSHLSIVPAAAVSEMGEDDPCVGTFSVRAECLAGCPEYPCCFGICRGTGLQPSDPRDPRDKKLSDRLQGDGYETDDSAAKHQWWSGSRYFRDESLPAFRKDDPETLALVCSDNQNNDHPAAKQVAKLLWDLFEKCRPDLEDLNSSYPYALTR